MAEGPYTCPCGHPNSVGGEAWETTTPNGSCSERDDHETGAAKCKCHDADGRRILQKGTPEAYAHEARQALYAEKARAADALGQEAAAAEEAKFDQAVAEAVDRALAARSAAKEA